MHFLLMENCKFLKKMKKNIVANLLVQLLILNSANSTAAIIGGGDAGVARECISKGFNIIDWYELDP